MCQIYQGLNTKIQFAPFFGETNPTVNITKLVTNNSEMLSKELKV